jgi:REP element-mobilizing transposase RayT
MPRTERKISKTNIYHVMLRGINKQLIFEEPEDYLQFLHLIVEVKKLSGFKLFAYCLMGNHVHLLLKECEEPLAQVFKRIGVRYAVWFNRKYKRSGHLFQDRFKSEPVESDQFFLMVLTYIHQNPVNAGLCGRPEDYEWSSRKNLGHDELVDIEDLLDIISISDITDMEQEVIQDVFLESKPKPGRKLAMPDDKVFAWMKDLGGVASMTGFQALEHEFQASIYARLRKSGVSIRQFARLSGLSRGVVERMSRAGNETGVSS